MSNSWIEELKYNSEGLLPVVAQDASTGEVLMVAYVNKEALSQTIETKKATFFSRSRNQIWQKGETSGNVLDVVDVLVDCDKDTVLYKVKPTGPACHTGKRSCFYTQVQGNGLVENTEASKVVSGHVLDELWAVLLDRKEKMPEGSYTAKLFAKGDGKILGKITEEASEVVNAVVHETDQRLVEETADLWFHGMVLLAKRGVSISEVWNELAKRRK